jgi:UDP-N-acetylglucosamine--N-acetylmuramyl-(pentapeptide) pyrophosphoryl-undecaprenol N-acetylglucosamine transferase
MKFIFACGGTGGHIFPAIAIAEELLKRKNVEILFTGSDEGMEKNITRKYNFRFASISAKPLIRRITIQNLINMFYILKAIFESLNIIRNYNPDFVIGTGGFVSFPVLFAAVLMKKKTLIHEPNVYPGIANRILGLFVTKITIGFKETGKYFLNNKTKVTGNPVRNSILNKSKIAGIKYFKLDKNKKTVLIMPGSRAAKKINDIISISLKTVEKELKNIQVIWMTGKADYQKIKKVVSQSKIKIRVFDFIYDAGLAYASSDVAVLRAGASTLSEIVALQIPAILIPYPYATDNHQEKNAMLFQKNKAAVVIKDNELNTEKLIDGLKFLLNKKNNITIRKNIKKLYVRDSVKKIVNFIMEN